MLEKGRATLLGKNGEYIQFPTDQCLVQFLGFNPDALLKELATGIRDGEMLEWVQAHSKTPRAPWEILPWSLLSWKNARRTATPKHLRSLPNTWAGFPKPGDVKTWFEFGELDDYVSFGGRA